MPFDTTDTDLPPHLQGVHRLAARARAKDEARQRQMRAAGSDWKLISERDRYPHMFAEISAQTSKWRS